MFDTKCNYHETDNAVTTCQHCEKALYKPCAVKYNPCFCDECFAIKQATIEENRTCFGLVVKTAYEAYGDQFTVESIFYYNISRYKKEESIWKN